MPPDDDELLTQAPAGTATPEAPAPAASAPADGSDGDADLWSDLDEELDDLDVLNQGEDIAAAPAAEPTPPEPTAPTPAAVEPAPEPVAAAPVEPAPQAPTPVEPVPTPPEQPTQEPTAEQVAQLRSNYLAQLEESYKLTPQEVTDLELDIGKNLPRVAAQLHMRVAESVTQTLAQVLPQLINQHTQAVEQSQKGLKAFYGAWPELNKPEYAEKIASVAEVYTRLNPKATLEQRIQHIGAQAWALLGLPVDRLLTRGQPSVAAVPQQPSAPPSTVGGFAPANPGGATRGGLGSAQQSDNPFVRLAEEFLHEE